MSRMGGVKERVIAAREGGFDNGRHHFAGGPVEHVRFNISRL
jgi:hypothetical protein